MRAPYLLPALSYCSVCTYRLRVVACGLSTLGYSSSPDTRTYVCSPHSWFAAGCINWSRLDNFLAPSLADPTRFRTIIPVCLQLEPRLASHYTVPACLWGKNMFKWNTATSQPDMTFFTETVRMRRRTKKTFVVIASFLVVLFLDARREPLE